MTSTVKDQEPTYPYFAEATSAEVVNARMGPNVNPRLKQVMEAVVRHLHAAVKEVEPTHEEWMAAIDFLTKTGQMCSEWRQEYILFSDVLGVSMLVDSINNRRPSGSTPNTILGPFYIPNSPKYELGANICQDSKGEPLVVRGRVVNTEGMPVPGAIIEAWQTNNDGFYDVQQKGVQPDMNMRGTFESDADGRYWFRSVKPRFYPIPSDGPVGQLLEKLGRHPNRASHIHIIITAPGYQPVITHIFPPDCEYLSEDAVFGVKEDLIADFQRIDDPKRAEELNFTAPFWSVEWDFTLAHAVRT